MLFLPVALTVTWLNLEKHQVRKSIKRKIISSIDRSELVSLVFHKKELSTKLRWEHAKEFEYDGQMYDIVETSIDDDSVRYWCWWDFEETRLNKKLDNLFADEWTRHSPKKEKHIQLFEWMDNLYIHGKTHCIEFPTVCLRQFQYNNDQLLILPCRAPIPVAQPPEGLSS